MFENNSIAKGSTTDSAASSDWQYLIDINQIPYIFVVVHNATSTPGATFYSQKQLTTDRFFSPDAYYLVTFKFIDYTAVNPRAFIYLGLTDEGGEDHELDIELRIASGTNGTALINSDSDGKTDDVRLTLYFSSLSAYFTVQIKIAYLFESVGLNTNFVKVNYIKYHIAGAVNDSIADNYIKAAIRHTVISNKGIKVNDNYVNGTKIELDTTVILTTGDYEITKIADVSIPFKYSPQAEKTFNANALSAKYDWLFSLPDDNSLSFSSVVANLTLGDLESYTENISYFYVSGTDYKETLQNQGYYSFAVSAGVQYYISLKFEGLPESVYDSLIEIGTPPAGGIVEYSGTLELFSLF